MDDSSGNEHLHHERASCPVIIGLGGNIGAVRGNLSRVIAVFQADFSLLRVSDLYQTVAIGPEQPDFLNAAVLINYPGELHQLLGELQEMEAQLGRVRLEKWGPRTVDLDILWAGEKIISTSTLNVPHRELRKRAFALLPLLDVFSAAKDPSNGCPYREVFGKVGGEGVARIAQGRWWEALSPS